MFIRLKTKRQPSQASVIPKGRLSATAVVSVLQLQIFRRGLEKGWVVAVQTNLETMIHAYLRPRSKH